MKQAVWLVAFLALTSPLQICAQPPVAPPGSVLADDAGWTLVYAHCSACHSLRLVVQQRGDRDTWRRLIRWMQETQNLWEFEPAVEAAILDYLARNYAPERPTRRAPLPDHLLPSRG
jgi:hypothetical protein